MVDDLDRVLARFGSGNLSSSPSLNMLPLLMHDEHPNELETRNDNTLHCLAWEAQPRHAQRH